MSNSTTSGLLVDKWKLLLLGYGLVKEIVCGGGGGEGGVHACVCVCVCEGEIDKRQVIPKLLNWIPHKLLIRAIVLPYVEQGGVVFWFTTTLLSID